VVLVDYNHTVLLFLFSPINTDDDFTPCSTRAPCSLACKKDAGQHPS
jgi:hypothetical protein